MSNEWLVIIYFSGFFFCWGANYVEPHYIIHQKIISTMAATSEPIKKRRFNQSKFYLIITEYLRPWLLITKVIKLKTKVVGALIGVWSRTRLESEMKGTMRRIVNETFTMKKQENKYNTKLKACTKLCKS